MEEEEEREEEKVLKAVERGVERPLLLGAGTEKEKIKVVEGG